MEVKRQLDVLDRRLAEHPFLAGPEYTIADIAAWPWYGQFVRGKYYGASAEFLQVQEYEHVQRWAAAIAERPAVARGHMVNQTNADTARQVLERHSDADFPEDLRRLPG